MSCLPLRGRWPEGPEGESLARIATASYDIALSPTACGRSPLPEGAKKKAPLAERFLIHFTYSLSYNTAGTAAGTGPWHP